MDDGSKNREVIFYNLGSIDYKEAWDYQTELFEHITQIKTANRELSPAEQKPTPNYLLFCEHPHVYTLGKSGDASHLLMDEKTLQDKGVSYYHINRGGDITYHGPGQLVVYPILDLDNFFTDIHKYLRYLEEAVMLTLADMGMAATRIDGLTGVWLEHPARKICALGVKTGRWITMHGLALNVNPDLSFFGGIVPCGIQDKAVTSIALETGQTPDMDQVKKRMLSHLAALFNMQIIEPAYEKRH